MATTLRPLLIFSILVSLYVLSSAQSCLKYKFTGNKSFQYCNDLPYLNSYIHYTYNASEGSLQFAYRHTEINHPGTWVAWAINPIHLAMKYGQAFVAYPREDGSLSVYTSSLMGERPLLMAEEIMLPSSNLSATFINNEIVIFATVKLLDNKTTINQLWQAGPVSDEIPSMHDTASANMMSMGTLNVLSGIATYTQAVPVNSAQKRKNLHATFNVVGWGVMMPIGIMLGRYVKVIETADKIWFYIHVTWQTLAYIVGVTGWAIGIKIGGANQHTKDLTHKALGYTLFGLATLQVMALFLRPKKEHKYRFYWTMYHKIMGHSIVIIAIVNIFKGFFLLRPVQKWMKDYTGTIIVLFVIGLFLEYYTQKIKEERNQRIGLIKQPHIQLGYSATDGYEGRNRYGI